MRKSIRLFLTLTLCLGLAACGAEENAEEIKDNGAKVETENKGDSDSAQEEESKDTADEEKKDVEEAEAEKVCPKAIFASTGSVPDNPRIIMFMATPDGEYVPKVNPDPAGSNNKFDEFENVTISSQYYNEENDLAVESIWVYQYDEDTVISVKTRATGAAGPNKPRLETDIYVYDLAMETGITEVLHSKIYDHYDTMNSSFTYDFSNREYMTGKGNSLGKMFYVCEEQEFVDSLAAYGLRVAEESEPMAASELQNSPQSFDAPVIVSDSELILSITGRNAELPDEFDK